MKTFRIINQKDVTTKDFNDLPFWIDVEGELVWVAIQHHVHESELYDTLVVQRVIDNKAQPAWQNYALDCPDQLIDDLSCVIRYPTPIVFMSPVQLHLHRRMCNEARVVAYKYKRCECETEQGEPCYCNLK